MSHKISLLDIKFQGVFLKKLLLCRELTGISFVVLIFLLSAVGYLALVFNNTKLTQRLAIVYGIGLG
jgi:hypothetical protein